MTTILHVEDETRVTKLVRLMLKGYDYIAVTNIKDALDIIKLKKINLILLDLKLLKEKKLTGEFEGVKLLDELIKLKKHINVILLTGLSEQAKIIKMNYPIIKAVIGKPFRIKELRNAINKYAK